MVVDVVVLVWEVVDICSSSSVGVCLVLLVCACLRLK